MPASAPQNVARVQNTPSNSAGKRPAAAIEGAAIAHPKAVSGVRPATHAAAAVTAIRTSLDTTRRRPPDARRATRRETRSLPSEPDSVTRSEERRGGEEDKDQW